jgi:hypothetical protein
MRKEIDPDGDLLIILTPSTEPFAVWQDDTLTEDESMTEDTGSTSFQNLANMAQGCEANQSEDDTGSDSEPEKLCLKVSSKHLCFTAPRFKKMMAGTWMEATTTYPDGLRHVDIEGFDAKAFEMVMHIIHGVNGKVPRRVTLDQLAKVAVIVDDLECHEAVEIFVVLWMQALESPTDLPYGRDLVLWIFVSSVFRLKNIFKSVSGTAIAYSKGPIQKLGLPLRDKVIGEY